MPVETKRFGWTGKGLRINLSTGEVSIVPTQKDWIGGTTHGYKIFWDEVPPKTMAVDEANKLVIAPGPLTGTGAVCSGRTSITTMYPTTYPTHMIGSAHVGGDIGAKIKYAGYDFVIIEGKAKEPVYIYINNDDVQIRPANHIWSERTRRSHKLISQETSPTASVSVIGSAGSRKYVRVSCQQCSEPPCVRVCPTGAAHIDPATNIVTMDNSRCVGCKYCIAGCPYNVRFINEETKLPRIVISVFIPNWQKANNRPVFNPVVTMRWCSETSIIPILMSISCWMSKILFV